MESPHPSQAGDSRGLSRRHLLLGGAAGVGALTAAGVDLAVQNSSRPPSSSPNATPASQAIDNNSIEPFYGVHQAGIATEPQAHASYLAFDLRPETDRGAIKRMLRILTDDAIKLTSGMAALADSEPELAHIAARLTITFGFGPELVRRVDPGALPEWLAPLPQYSQDRLEDALSHGDLLLHIGADDPITVAHAARMVVKDTRAFATLRWTQNGFLRARGSQKPGTTMRNLFGQLDGTSNPRPGTEDFERVVWSSGKPAWLVGGTSLVLRRISMDLDKWDRLDRSGREAAVGRRLDNGAPLTGVHEHDEPDFTAKDPLGFPVISDISHLRRARSDNPAERIYRRSYNYDEPPAAGHDSNAGLLFASYQANPLTQFAPIQRRLDELDLLNEWITHVGSAVFAIPPGCAKGGYVGDALFPA
ncbi:Dyp-type peroxidase [Lysinibacter sp. HNR]|uniref:Dyp-type peroxidase n=1 Tax=Lysinibacter sp. HNR TaxID=3031408 RepID=UPI002434A386|nr:Dyp-type peroxidase [Lysinibacter sp. HNR]WGD37925.1 Dyp-type peroxidase [Lysinibacter sp. HNR]